MTESSIKVKPSDDHYVTRAMREQRLRQKPLVIWFTGFSGAGKTTTAQALEYQLYRLGYKTYLLDGDTLHSGLCSNLGFSHEDRQENIRRIAQAAKLLVDAGLIVLVSTISPLAAHRAAAKTVFHPTQFLEVFVDTPIEVCEQRDPKGLYKKARHGDISDFTGIGSPYEPPKNPDIHVKTNQLTVTAIVDKLLLPQITVALNQ